MCCIHYGNGDVGGLVNVSGAAIMKNAHNADGAQQFLKYLVSGRAGVDGQEPHQLRVSAACGRRARSAAQPFDQLQPPALSLEQLGNDSQAGKLLRQAGLI